METLHGKKQKSIDRLLEFSKLGKAFYVVREVEEQLLKIKVLFDGEFSKLL